MKAKDVRNLTAEEITSELARLRRHLYDLRSQAVTEKLENPTQLGQTRRDVSRLLTEQRSRTLVKKA